MLIEIELTHSKLDLVLPTLQKLKQVLDDTADKRAATTKTQDTQEYYRLKYAVRQLETVQDSTKNPESGTTLAPSKMYADCS